MSEGGSSLRYAVRLPVVAKYLGQLGIMLALLTLAPLAAALWFGDEAMMWRLLAVLGLLLLLSLPAARLPAPRQLQGNEALVVVCGAFILGPLLMTLPFMAAGLSFADALFETVSAVTTTGLSTVSNIEAMPRTFLFSRAWMQWYGGLGIVVLSVALLMGHHVATRRLVEPGGSEGIVTTARTHARRTLAVYLLLTIAGIAIATPLLGGGFTTLNHVLAAVSTGGFSSFNDGLAALPQWHQRLALLAIAVSGSVPLVLYYRVLHGGWREVAGDGELWLLGAMLVLTTLLLYAFAAPLQTDAALQSLALALSAQSTTGFATGEVAALTPAAKLVAIIAMLSGGGLGSTAGGVKLLRLILLFKLLQLYLRRSAAPDHAVIEPRLGGRAVGEDELSRALAIILLYIGVVVASWLVFLGFGYAPLDALFEVVSAVGTVGLSTGITSEQLPALLKGVLGVDMLLGRLEIIALLVLCYPPTWFGKRTEST